MNGLTVTGKQIFMGKEIPVVRGGFGADKKSITDKAIAEIHDMETRNVRARITENINRFKESIDFIDLKGAYQTSTLNMALDLGYTKSAITQAEHIYILSERGYAKLIKIMDTDLAWEIYDRLVDEYFKANELVNEQLSPELQVLQGILNQMAQKELADKERDRQIALANEAAQKAIETTEAIKEAVRPVFDNWREEVNKKFNRIQQACDCQFSTLRTEMYAELEQRAGCDLNTRLRNKKERMQDAGRKKTDINNTNKMDVIEESKQLREIFSKIVAEYEVRYCA